MKGRTRVALAWMWAALAVSVGAAEPAAYVDREIEGLAPEPVDPVAAEPYDSTGWPRYVRLETRVGTRPFDPERQVRAGFSAYGLLETPNHGALSIDGTLSPRERESTLTLRQRGLPLQGGWLVNNEVGVITPPAVSVLTTPSRVFLPSTAVRGASTEWQGPRGGVTLLASQGQPGQQQFLPDTGFDTQPGTRRRIGLQWRPDAAPATPAAPLGMPGWTVALQAEEGRGVLASSGRLPATTPVDARSSVGALRYEGPSARWQANWLQSQGSGGSARGVWAEGEWDHGPWRHGAGGYRLEPGLSWAEQPVANNLEGVYARSGWRSRQWSAEASLDLLRNLLAPRNNGYFLTLSGRWRLSATDSLSAGAAVRDFGGYNWTQYLDWRTLNGWGPAGLRLDISGGENGYTERRLTYDQEWPVPRGWQFNTSASVNHVPADPVLNRPGEHFWGLAASGAAPLSPSASLRGTLLSERSSNGQARHAVNLGSTWRVAPRWSLEGYYQRSTGRSRQILILDPLAPPLTDTLRLADRSFYVVLRYEFSAGSRDVPLGGRPNQGGGTIRGVVYFDANRSGTQEASERGVPNVTVFLDNRFSVRTDDQGRFEFPFVASGDRAVTVRNDTLPLPWSVVGDGQTRLTVSVRETTTLSLPVQRSE